MNVQALEIVIFVFSSVKSLDRLGRLVDMRDDSAEIFFPVFSAGGPCEQFGHGQACPLSDVVHPAFLLPTTASPTLQGDLKVACDMPEPCKFPSLE